MCLVNLLILMHLDAKLIFCTLRSQIGLKQDIYITLTNFNASTPFLKLFICFLNDQFTPVLQILIPAFNL